MLRIIVALALAWALSPAWTSPASAQIYTGPPNTDVPADTVNNLPGLINPGGVINETGNSKGEQTLPPYQAFGKDIENQILNAEKGETIKLKTDTWTSFPDYVMKALAARRDLTLALTYKYEGAWYTTIIPAGAEVPTDVPYAGFSGYLGGLYGRTKVEK
ncbi:hypothetical protein LJB86_01085 [Deltaproteobacteria bacterium OttesenSCG-928-M10]|nr:hypothetical protein [Deltaproteobacteria bacterium OttesenSCG-928-M10]